MALFRKFFYRKPPDGLLEISERVFVFDCCFTTDVLEDDEYKVYIGGIVGQLREYFPDASFMVFNFREGEKQSQIANILSEFDMTVMDYPRQYESCPLLTMEMIHHFLRSSESWLSLGQRNVLLMHCERGGWPVLAFMLAALLIYRKQYIGEQKTLDMIYKQAPRELLQLMSPLNPLPSQLRYLQYVSRRNVGSQWPPLDRALTLDCVILRVIPNMDGEGGCCPIFRIYGQDPFMAADRTPKVLFSTPRRSKTVRHYKQADCELVKIDIHCHIQGDVVLECISLDNDLEREEMMFRVMFNTAFIRSNILMLNRDAIDVLWSAKDQFPKDFRTEVLFSEMDAASSLISIDLPGIEEKEGLPIEAFAKVQEIFSNVDWLDPKTDVALNMLQQINILQEKLEAGTPRSAKKGSVLQELSPEKVMEKLKSEASENSSPSIPLGKQSMPSLKPSLDANSTMKKIEPQELQVSLQQRAQSKIISQGIPQTHLSTPASYCNSFQGVLQEPTPEKVMEKPKFEASENSSPSIPLGKQSLPSLKPSLDANSTMKKIEPQELLVSLQRPAQSKIISQRIPQTPLSTPASYCNSFQGSPVPISRYHSAPSALGITALLHDHTESKIKEVTQPVTISPPPAASAPVPHVSKPLQPIIASIPPPPQPPPSLQLSKEFLTTGMKTSVTPPPPLPVPNHLSALEPSPSLSTQYPETSLQGRGKSSSVPPPPPPPSSLSGASPSSVKNSFSSPPPPPPPPTLSGASPSSFVKNSFSSPPPPPPFPSLSGASPSPFVKNSFSSPPPPPPFPSLSGASPSSSVKNSFSSPTLPPPPPCLSGASPSSSVKNSFSSPPPLLAVASPSSSVKNSFSSPPPPPPPPSYAGAAPSPTNSNSFSTPPPAPPPPPPSSSGAARSPTIMNSSSTPPLPPPGVPSSAPCSVSSPLHIKTSAIVAGPPPPPPPPLRSGSASSPIVAPSAPPPPLPPSTAPKDLVLKNSLHVPPVPPPPAPFANGLSKSGGASPQSHSAGSNGNVPPIPGPPFIAKGRLQPRATPRNQAQSKKTSLKPYHWLKLTRAMQGSLWADAQKSDESSKAPEFDMSELESLFSASVPTSDHGSAGGKSNRRASGPKSDKVQLIDLRRAYNCEIMLTKVKVPLPDLMSSVLALDDSALDVDQVDNLIKFCPTKEEMELLKNFNGDKENLGKCEQFFLELMKVPRVESKLRVFSFKIQFHSQVSDLRSSLNIVNSTSEEIRNSVKLKRIMQTILSLGNALNHGTARGSAIGFRLDSLLKLTDTRARNKKMTLMHYLCKVLAEKLPELLDFQKDLVSLEASTKIQLKYLAEEMQAISKGLEKVVQELSASENDGPVSENFCKTLKEFLGFAEAEVRALALLYSGVGRNADALALYFGEDPARCPFEQVVSTLLNFVRMFVRAHEENCKQLEFEKKKAQKEATNEKIKTSVSKKESENEKVKTSAPKKEAENEKMKTSVSKESEHLIQTPIKSSNNN